MNRDSGEIKVLDKRNVFIAAYHIVRDEGFWALVDRLIPSWLPTMRSYLLSDFRNMPRILSWLENHSQYDVYSFDVFDTLLRRRIDPPELIKALAAEYLSTRLAQHGINISQVEILAQRRRCEELLLQEALSRGKDADYHLDDVVAETLKVIKAEHVLGSEQIVNYEIGLEKKAAQPIPGAVAVLTYLKSVGKRVICISDSYLSASQMAAILEHHDLLQYIDKLYVSSDIGKRKSTGRLFQYAIEKEDKKIVHIGDNYDSDYIMPKKLGIKALWFHSRSEQGRKSELRKLIHSKNKMNYVNAIIRSPNGQKSELQRVGYEVLGPALTVFVHSVAEQARKDKVEALFFVARDGYAMKKIYETLQRTVYGECALPPGRYMCLGRLPVRLASLHELNYAQMLDAYAYISRFRERSVSLKDILGSYGLELGAFITIAKRYEIDFNDPIIDPAQNERLHQLLSSNEFQEIVRGKSAEARKLLRDYLANIGFMGKRRVAVVDANAEGLTQSILDRIFSNDKDYPAVSCYYFNLVTLNVNKAGINLDSSRVIGVVGDWRRDSENKQRPFRFAGILIEIFSHPNHGVTVGYRKTNGKTVPIFKKTPQASQYKITSQGLQGILAYAKNYSMYYSLHNYKCEELLEYMKSNIIKWVESPQKRDAAALRGLFLTSDWPVTTNHILVQQITFFDILTIRGLQKKLASAVWPEASLKLAPVPGFEWIFYKTASFRNQVYKLSSCLDHLRRA